MNAIYTILGTSKQAHHQRLRRHEAHQRRRDSCVPLIEQARELHPGMGLVAIYELTRPKGIGRKAFVELGKQEGYMLDAPRSYIRTTHSVKSSRYGNLLHGRWFTGVNQLWSVDITYFQPGPQTYYLFFLLDVYSRRILGYCAAEDMKASNNLNVLRMALQQRRGQSLLELIHHSDRGSQYNARAYTDLLDKQGIAISMCKSALENAHIERVHGTIKNDYLHHWENSSLRKLRQNLKRAVETYNTLRPHSSLHNQTPCDYEQQLEKIPECQRTKMKIFVSEASKRQTVLKNQLVLFY